MRTILLSSLLVVGTGLYCIGAPAHGQGFDCRYARSPDEQMVCRDPRLSRLDEQLNSVYAREYYGQQGAARGRLDQAEDAWVIERRRCGADYACIEQSYRRRIEQLGGPGRPAQGAIPQPQQGAVAPPQHGVPAQPQQSTAAPPHQSVIVQPPQGVVVPPPGVIVVRPEQAAIPRPEHGPAARLEQGSAAQPQHGAAARPEQGTVVRPEPAARSARAELPRPPRGARARAEACVFPGRSSAARESS